jgi:hypothetical protein
MYMRLNGDTPDVTQLKGGDVKRFRRNVQLSRPLCLTTNGIVDGYSLLMARLPH